MQEVGDLGEMEVMRKIEVELVEGDMEVMVVME